jgi:hypothetical protein
MVIAGIRHIFPGVMVEIGKAGGRRSNNFSGSRSTPDRRLTQTIALTHHIRPRCSPFPQRFAEAISAGDRIGNWHPDCFITRQQEKNAIFDE